MLVVLKRQVSEGSAMVASPKIQQGKRRRFRRPTAGGRPGAARSARPESPRRQHVWWACHVAIGALLCASVLPSSRPAGRLVTWHSTAEKC